MGKMPVSHACPDKSNVLYIIKVEFPFQYFFFALDYEVIMRWAYSYRSMQVFAEVRSFADLCRAVEVGADGIGCLRSDFLFRHDNERLDLTRSILLTDDHSLLNKYLDKMYITLIH